MKLINILWIKVNLLIYRYLNVKLMLINKYLYR